MIFRQKLIKSFWKVSVVMSANEFFREKFLSLNFEGGKLKINVNVDFATHKFYQQTQFFCDGDNIRLIDFCIFRFLFSLSSVNPCACVRVLV